MNVLSSFILYLLAFFGMITLALFNILPLNYLGGIVVALFITGLLYSWLNAWRQTATMVKKDSIEQPELEREETELEAEYPIIFHHAELKLKVRELEEMKKEISVSAT